MTLHELSLSSSSNHNNNEFDSKETLSSAISSSSSTTAIRKKKVSIGYATLGGTDPDRPQKVNQDSYFTFETSILLNNNSKSSQKEVIVVGVMDGHGLKGHIVTNYLKTQIPYRFQQFTNQWNNNQEVNIEERNINNSSCSCCLLPNPKDQEMLSDFLNNLHRLGHYPLIDNNDEEEGILTFQNTACIQVSTTSSIDNIMIKLLRLTNIMVHIDACQDPSIPAGRSGTTCVVSAIVMDRNDDSPSTTNKLFTANVGDSRAILWSASRGKKKSTNTNDFQDGEQAKSLGIHVLSTETTLSKQSLEHERIRYASKNKDGGKIIGNNVFYGPVGIAMTRALGDAVMLRAGVVPVPQITIEELSSNNNDDNDCSMIILGTDGIFDVLSNENVIECIQEHTSKQKQEPFFEDLNETAAALVHIAEERWSHGLPMDVKSDDMTCVIVLI